MVINSEDMVDTTFTDPSLPIPDWSRYSRLGHQFMMFPYGFRPLVPIPPVVKSNLELFEGRRAQSNKPARSLMDVVYDIPQFSNAGKTAFFHDVPFLFHGVSGAICSLNSIFSPPTHYLPAKLIFYHNTPLKRNSMEDTGLEIAVLNGTMSGIIPGVVLTGFEDRPLRKQYGDVELAEPLQILAATFAMYTLGLAEQVKEMRNFLVQSRKK